MPNEACDAIGFIFDDHFSVAKLLRNDQRADSGQVAVAFAVTTDQHPPSSRRVPIRRCRKLLVKDVVSPLNQVGERTKVGRQRDDRPTGIFNDRPDLVVGHDVRATETVDGLLGIANDEQRARNRVTASPVRFVGVVRCQEHHDLCLHRVGILELVNAEMCKPPPEILTNRGLVSKKISGSHQQILVVQAATLLSQFVVSCFRFLQHAQHGDISLFLPALHERLSTTNCKLLPAILFLFALGTPLRPLLLNCTVATKVFQ